MFVFSLNIKLLKPILSLCLLLLSLSSYAQEYFNNHFEFDNINVADGGENILELDDGYIVNGVGGDSLNINWFRWGLAKFNHSGEFIWGKSWGDTISRRYFARHGSLFSFNNSTYALGGIESYYPEGTHAEVALIKFDSNYDTVWVSQFGKGQYPQDSSYTMRDIETIGNGFAITGNLVIDYGEIHQPFLLFLDSIGGFQNIVYYPDSNFFFHANTIVKTLDGGFAIGAYKLWIVSGGHKGHAYILKTDSIGNLEWELNLGGDYINGTAMVCNTADSCIVATSKYDTDSVFYNENRSNIRVTKLDYDGNIIWDNYYTKGKRNSGVTGISNDNNQGFIISGFIGETIYEVEPDVVAYMLKINNDGDSIWFRQYSIFNGFRSDNRLYYPIATSDGGYAAIGTGRPRSPDEGTMDAWIIKVDSMGCVNFDDCWVGINEEKLIDKEETAILKVFPNPAETYFNIECDTDDSIKGDFICTIFNLFGRKVKEVAMPNKTIMVNCSNWNNGIYFIKISKNGKLIGSEKIMIK